MGLSYRSKDLLRKSNLNKDPTPDTTSLSHITIKDLTLMATPTIYSSRPLEKDSTPDFKTNKKGKHHN